MTAFPLQSADLAANGIRTDQIDRLTALIEKHIGEGRYPGCQVALARHGKLLLERSWGQASVGDAPRLISRGRNSTRVTATPRARAVAASSSPITPPPTTSSRAPGTRALRMRWRLRFQHWLVFASMRKNLNRRACA